MTSFTLHAPAKLNLSLRILKKRADGFHEIDTVMVKLPGLADSLEFREAPEFSFSCDDPNVPNDGKNLVVKAVRAYEIAAQTTCKCSISLKKIIPHGAGLGGGSSDAAATLLGINRLNSDAVSVEALHEIASSLGSDIPFFLTSGAARCTARGEVVSPIAGPPAFPVLLLKPSFSVETPDAYKRWNESFQTSDSNNQITYIQGFELINNLEGAVFHKHRFLGELKHWLLQRHEIAGALMSGSGSTVFAIMHDIASVDSVAAAAQMELDPTLWYWAGWTEGTD